MTLTRLGPKTYSPGSFGRKKCEGKTGIGSNFKNYLKLKTLIVFCREKYEAISKLIT